MAREPGLYFVKHHAGDEWTTIRWVSGEYWVQYDGTQLPASQGFHELSEERIATPDEVKKTVEVPVGAWAQALNASEAIKVGDVGSTEAALQKMCRLMHDSP